MSDILLSILMALGALMFGIGLGADVQEQSILDDCKKLGATRIEKSVVTCAVRSEP